MKTLLFCLGLLAAPAIAETPLESIANSAIAPAMTARDITAYHITCTAVSGFGLRRQRFHGFGLNRWMASRHALKKCHNASFTPRTCRIAYCRPRG